MEIEDERRVTREEAAEALEEIAERLRDGEVSVGGQSFPVPDELDLEVEYEEEPDETEFEIELEWRTRETKGAEENSPGLSYGDTKDRMEDLIDGMLQQAKAGRVPAKETLNRFLELNRDFARYAEGEQYEGMMPNYERKVLQLREAFEKEDASQMKSALEAVKTQEEACHDIYK